MKKIHFEEATKTNLTNFTFDPIPSVPVILEDIRENGEDAIRKYNKRFDGGENYPFEVTKDQISRAFDTVDTSFVDALEFAKKHIEEFATMQREQFRDLHIENRFGSFGHYLVPIQRVCCYVPGGNYPLPSTALMTVIPAKIAGVKEVYVTSPRIRDETIVAAKLGGADRIFRLGGVQAIGTFAYGAGDIPQVDKIVGPGNKYVTAAKKEVYGIVGLDFLAGPSEVLIIADEKASIPIIAADLLAQAEHDTDARIFLVSTSEKVVNEAIREVQAQLMELETRSIAEQAVQKGIGIICENNHQIIEISNQIAPEHLEIQLEEPSTVLDKLENYGSLFIGKQSAEVFGDYCSGPNHTLPTGRASRYTGGLSVMDFIKIQTHQTLNSENMADLIKSASSLARVEGLDGHHKAALMRVDDNDIVVD